MGAVAYVTAALTTGPGETTNLKEGETVVFAPTVWVTTTFGVEMCIRDRLSQRAEVQHVLARGPEQWTAAIRVTESDLGDAGAVAAFDYAESPDVSVTVTLATN